MKEENWTWIYMQGKFRANFGVVLGSNVSKTEGTAGCPLPLMTVGAEKSINYPQQVYRAIYFCSTAYDSHGFGCGSKNIYYLMIECVGVLVAAMPAAGDQF
jgi:hypothetical protein